MAKNFNARSVNIHQFSMIPRADIPRSSFKMESAYKTTFDSGYLVPIYLNEVLPGDQISLSMTAFTRLTTPLYPIMDNLHMDTFFFFVPNRLVWDNWQKFMGERIDPDDSIDFLVPQMECPAGGYAIGSLQDYMGLPTVGQVASGKKVSHMSLFLRAYNLIWNEWFRDENLQDSVVVDRGDGPDDPADYVLLRRGKRHDYFTSCLPWPQKGEAVTLPLGDSAPVVGIGVNGTSTAAASDWYQSVGKISAGTPVWAIAPDNDSMVIAGQTVGAVGDNNRPQIFADLSEATAITVNALRQSVQIQRLLERDARGGTRYVEILRSHFGVISPDARLQRPEYLGGGSSPVNINPVAQTSGTTVTGSDSPLGTLAAIGTSVNSGHGFTQSFTEHGMVIGLVSVRADLSYQQGLRRMWSRKTRYDYYFPVFAHLGEQAVLNKEIYVTGDTTDEDVFGYQERWAEYRYMPSMITGRFRSTAAQTLDGWHLSQRFTSLPTLSDTFIQDNPPVERVLAVESAPGSSQFYFDAIFESKATRPMPLYSVPGLMDHF